MGETGTKEGRRECHVVPCARLDDGPVKMLVSNS